jgi:predicted pyridoxine 5'-phosphate oxidase superfamily flavin-nucleotide-binding protein
MSRMTGYLYRPLRRRHARPGMPITSRFMCPSVHETLEHGRPEAIGPTTLRGLPVRAASATVGAMELSSDMQRVVLEQSLGFVATVTPDGKPNLSPKGTTTVLDAQHLMFADIASPGTVANLATNPNVEVNVVDPIVRKGYRFKGTATAYTSGDMFERGLAVLRERGSTTARERVRSIVVIEVTDAAPLFSPAYDTGASEASLAARWLRHHTELHRVE